MAPWPFFSARSAATTPDAIDDSLHTFPGTRDGLDHDSDVDGDFDDLRLPAPPFAQSDSPTSKKRHTRSLSGNLNNLFGAMRRSPSNPTTPNGFSSSPIAYDGPSSPRPKTAKQKDDGEEQTGSCATCASQVKWPAGFNEYRCGTCLMINDLKPTQRQPPSPKGKGQPFARAGTYPGNAPDRRGFPLSMDRTASIISRCLDEYLLAMQQAINPATDRSKPPPGPGPSNARVAGTAVRAPPTARSLSSPRSTRPHHIDLSSRVDQRSASAAAGEAIRLDKLRNAQPRLVTNSNASGAVQRPSIPLQVSVPQHPSRRPPPPPMQPFAPSENVIARKPLPKALQSPIDAPQDGQTASQPANGHDLNLPSARHIFKALEDYIVSTFGRHDSLNRSFSTLRPRPRPAARSEDNLRRFNSVTNTDKPLLFDGYDAQIDAKTLLLGDVAENGFWWAAKDQPASTLEQRAPTEAYSDLNKELVNLKSPHVHWIAVIDWYRLVIRCGESWRRRVQELGAEGKLDIDRVLQQAHEIESSFVEARVHVQKTLLKASETVLKRPGRPLRDPADIRFLLIILANPLIYPVSSSPLLRQVAVELETTSAGEPMGRPSTRQDASPTVKRGSNSGYWERGHAFGIIKRTTGLLSNLSNDCHRHLTNWVARYNEDRFTELVSLIQSFVTHRLGREYSTKRKDTTNGNDLVPQLSSTGAPSSAQLHAALGLSSPKKATPDGRGEPPPYSDDWQLKAAARVMAIFFTANKGFRGDRTATLNAPALHPGSISRQNIKHHRQLLSTSDFYNLKADYCDLIADFETWELSKTKFSICQYPFFFSVGSKIKILEHDAQRQMSVKAREAFFNSILHNKGLQQYLYLKVRRDCLVEDSLTAISETVAQGEGEFKKGLRIQFTGEEGVDAGGLRKEWFLLLVREIFDPDHGMFTYDEETHLCYFNPNTLEGTEQYFLVGALLGLAIYNLTILDVALPPFLFKKLLASGSTSGQQHTYNRTPIKYTLEDLSELRPSLARGLQQLLDFDGDVEETFCRTFEVEVERYGTTESVVLCANGVDKPVTNANRLDFVDLYIRYLLDGQVARQFEPFKRGFFTVCGGNALSLFQPEEIELLIRGSEEPLDVPSLKAAAIYENWRRGDRKVTDPAEEVDLIQWFWDFLEKADSKAQRRVLGFITGSDRIPAMGATSLVIKISYGGGDHERYPIARTCFNQLILYKYRSREQLKDRLWRAVTESEGFGLK